MPTPTFSEIFNYPIAEFRSVLDASKNERILFSGKYGSGKTSFLDNYFKPETQDGQYSRVKYEVYNISPINYSIASNEDIIKYIKYDIIIQFLEKEKSIKDLDLSILNTLPAFVFKNLHKVAVLIAHMTPKLGIDLAKIYEKIIELSDEFGNFHKENSKSDGTKLAEYLEELEAKEGGLYENDIITRIISSILNQDKSLGKETVLIVDDLDRLDPEHVFRILNVFASHFKNELKNGSINKFDFSKIIIVCDINNLRSIFQHKYGVNADFEGYIDKFYSSDVFQFDNKKAIINVLTNIVDSYKHDSPDNDSYKRVFWNSGFIQSLLTLFIKKDYVNLRSIIKTYDKELFSHLEIIGLDKDSFQVVAWRLPITMQLKLFQYFVGGYYNMRRILMECLDQQVVFDNFQEHFSTLMLVLSFKSHMLTLKTPVNFNYNNEVLGIKFTLDLNKQAKEIEIYKTIPVIDKNSENEISKRLSVTQQMFWIAMLDTIKLLHDVGYLHD